MKRIVIFASGNGTNADSICHYFTQQNEVEIAALFCNNANAGVIVKMEKWHVPVVLFNKQQLQQEQTFLALLQLYQPNLIVLAGFLWLIPPYFVAAFPNRIINIHPSLLPKFGGKGMYGHHVHEAVLAQKEATHGITIHLVNDQFDKGKPLFQQSFEVKPNDVLETVSAKIATLEMENFPKVIAEYLNTL